MKFKPGDVIINNHIDWSIELIIECIHPDIYLAFDTTNWSPRIDHLPADIIDKEYSLITDRVTDHNLYNVQDTINNIKRECQVYQLTKIIEK